MNDQTQPHTEGQVEQRRYTIDDYPGVPQEIIELFNGMYVLGVHRNRQGLGDMLWADRFNTIRICYLEPSQGKNIFDFIYASRSNDPDRFNDSKFFHLEQLGSFLIDGIEVEVREKILVVSRGIMKLDRDYKRDNSECFTPSLRERTRRFIIRTFLGEG